MTSLKSVFSSQDLVNPAAESRVKRLRPVLGTLCSIETAGNAVELDHIINSAFASIRQVNELMHPVWGVDLSRINLCTSQLININEWTWQVLHLAKLMNEVSNGIFDPCLPSQAGRLADVELISGNQVICHKPVTIDLGGIAKGFAIDCAIDVLTNAGCGSGLVNAGGDVRVFGEAQSLYISRDESALQLELRDRALAVSEIDNPERPSEHQGYYCRGSPSLPSYRRVAVQAESAMIADALTKCVIWQDAASYQYLCDHFGAQVLIAEK